jgi:queuosine precursor transporter
MSDKNYRLLPFITVLFVTVLLVSNIVSTKITSFWWFTFDGGTILFPLSYILGDVLTEIYWYKQARNVIWYWFFSIFLMSITIIIVWLLPPAPEWTFQQDYQNILGFTPRIVLASLFAFLLGSFSNAFIMAKLKVVMKWKQLWIRTIGSTIIGEWIDTGIFVLVAFYWIFPNPVLLTIIISNYIFKVWIEVIFTPLTYLTIGKLKNIEKENI